jgi:hypothetical protein
VIRPRKAGAINAGEPPPNPADASISVYLRGIAAFAGDFVPSVHQYGFGKPLWRFRFQGGEAVVDRIAASLGDLRVEHACVRCLEWTKSSSVCAPSSPNCCRIASPKVMSCSHSPAPPAHRLLTLAPPPH